MMSAEQVIQVFASVSGSVYRDDIKAFIAKRWCSFRRARTEDLKILTKRQMGPMNEKHLQPHPLLKETLKTTLALCVFAHLFSFSQKSCFGALAFSNCILWRYATPASGLDNLDRLSREAPSPRSGPRTRCLSGRAGTLSGVYSWNPPKSGICTRLLSPAGFYSTSAQFRTHDAAIYLSPQVCAVMTKFSPIPHPDKYFYSEIEYLSAFEVRALAAPFLAKNMIQG